MVKKKSTKFFLSIRPNKSPSIVRKKILSMLGRIYYFGVIIDVTWTETNNIAHTLFAPVENLYIFAFLLFFNCILSMLVDAFKNYIRFIPFV